MQGKRKGVRMISEMYRLKDKGLSNKLICKALGVSKNTLKKYLQSEYVEATKPQQFVAPWADKINWIDVRDKTLAGLALAHYHEEYVADENPEITYTSFWREYKRRFPNIPVHFHKIHPPGERCEIDYKGNKSAETFGYYDSVAGIFVACRLFGAVLCFSQYLFVRVTHSETQLEWLESTAKAYEYFGGVSSTTATDNAKALVSKAHKYDADINPEFVYFAQHYNTAPIAMRPAKPKDKNLIEGALGVFWRWIRFRIKGLRFNSLAELNRYILKELAIFNNRIQKKYGCSRYQKFIAGEKDKLMPLPANPYDCGEWKVAKVHPDCHIQIAKNYYSVPYQFVGKEVDVRVTRGQIEVFFGLERLTCHRKQTHQTSGRYVTKKEHWPPSLSELSLSSPTYWKDKAASIGVSTEIVVNRLINEATHPLQYLRCVMGVVRLAGRYSNKQLEASCDFFKERSFSELRLRNIEAVIKANLQKNPIETEIKRLPNNNLRGQKHWATDSIH